MSSLSPPELDQFSLPTLESDSKLVEGNNALAFEVHQINVGSSDLSIDARPGGLKVADGAAAPTTSSATRTEA